MRRPVLAPGLRVLRRSREELQVGLDPEHRVRLPDTEPVRRTLGHLLRGEAVPGDPESQGVLERLAPALVDAAGLVDADLDAADVAAIALQDPAGYPARLAARRGAGIGLVGTLGGVDPRPLLAAAGIASAEGVDTATAALVLSVGELDRGVLDPLVRRRVPHLVVRMIEGTAVVGPFVAPGRTACLRCIDTHHSADDPHATILAVRHVLARHDRRDGVAEPVDTLLATLAVAWAVRDLVTHVEGGQPSTWSATLRLTAALAPVTHVEWLRHPACGCFWMPDEEPSSTMAV